MGKNGISPIWAIVAFGCASTLTGFIGFKCGQLDGIKRSDQQLLEMSIVAAKARSEITALRNSVEETTYFHVRSY